MSAILYEIADWLGLLAFFFAYMAFNIWLGNYLRRSGKVGWFGRRS